MMVIDDPHFVVEPEKNTIPFLSCSFQFADSILRVKINGYECDVFLLTREGWKISGVLHSHGLDLDHEELRQAIITHPRYRLLALVDG